MGGVGKSFLIKVIVKFLTILHLNFSICCPTGKAAVTLNTFL